MEKIRDYEAIAWRAALMVLRSSLRDELRKRQLWEDFRQEVKLAAFIAQSGEFDIKQTSRFVQREIYRALRDYGFRRNGSRYERLDVCESEYIEQDDKPIPERGIES